VLDLGQEWTDLTLRPMVWGLLAARPGTLNAEIGRRLQDLIAAASTDARFVDALSAEGARVYQLTLDGYAHDGLDEFVNHLYYHGTLADLPDLPFLALSPEGEAPVNGEPHPDS
jgi:hypothetical protein